MIRKQQYPQHYLVKTATQIRSSQEQSIATLEKTLHGKSGRILLTELGIWMESIPEYAVAEFSFPIISGDNPITVGAWDEPAMV